VLLKHRIKSCLSAILQLHPDPLLLIPLDPCQRGGFPALLLEFFRLLLARASFFDLTCVFNSQPFGSLREMEVNPHADKKSHEQERESRKRQPIGSMGPVRGSPAQRARSFTRRSAAAGQRVSQAFRHLLVVLLAPRRIAQDFAGALNERPLGRIQRRGTGVAAGAPLYVVRTDVHSGTLVVGPRASLARTRVEARGTLHLPVDRVEAKFRYRSGTVPARVELDEEGFALELEEPVFAVAPGQIAVLYDRDAVVGAGIIAATTK